MLKEMKDRKQLENDLKKEMDSASVRVKQASIYADDAERIIDVLSKKPRPGALACASSFCLQNDMSKGKMRIRRKRGWETATCSECKKGFHASCCLLLTDELYDDDSMDCPRCKKWTITDYKKKVEALSEKLNEARDRELTTLTSVRSTNDSQLSILRGHGSRYEKIKAFLASKGVSRSNWFQSYTGREVREAVREQNLTEMFDLVGFAKTGDLWELLSSFRCMCNLAAPRFLSEVELNLLESVLATFVTSYRILVANADQSVKLHFMDCHLMEYAKKYGTIGLATEQAIEHLHALFNRYTRQFKCEGNAGKRLRRMMIEHLVVSKLTFVASF